MNDEPEGFNGSPLSIPQECVMNDYRQSPALKRKGAEGALHMFFSPYRVPVGLTDEEVAICVWIFRIVDAEKEALKKEQKQEVDLYQSDEEREAAFWKLVRDLDVHRNLVMGRRNLPEELSPCKPMTRENFRAGIYKVLAHISKRS